MAKKTVTTTEIETGEPGSEEVLDNAPDPNEMEPDAIRELLAVSDTTEVRWKVDCIAPPEKSGYCATYNSGDLSLDTIREQWGGGKFKITGWDALGKYVGRRTVQIKETPKSLVAQGPQLGELATLLNAGKTDSQNILLMMIKSQGEMLTALLSKPAPPPPPAIDPLQQQTTFLAMMASMKEIFKPEKSTGSDIDTLLKGLELGKEIMGGNSSGADWTDVLIRGFDTVKPVLAKAMEGANVPRPVPRVNPPPRVLTPPAPIINSPGVHSARDAPLEPPYPNVEGTEEENSMLTPQIVTWLSHVTKGLVLQASKNKSAELYAEVFLDNLPPFVTVEMILEQFKDETALDKLSALNADVLKYREWFAEFREAVLDFLGEVKDEVNTAAELESGKVDMPMDNRLESDDTDRVDE